MVFIALARAAALGLDYPGVHGAPDLHRPSQNGMQPSTTLSRPHLYQQVDPNRGYYTQRYPRVGLSDGIAHKQTHPWNSESSFQRNPDTYSPVEREYATQRDPGVPRGLPVSNLGSDFEQVKHAASAAWAATPGQPELMNWKPQGHAEPLPFVYNEHDLVFDRSVPNRRATALTGLPLTHGIYHRGLAGYGFGDAPVLGFSHLPNQPYAIATRTAPMFPGWWRIWFPPPPVPFLHRSVDVKQVNPFFRPVINQHQ